MPCPTNTLDTGYRYTSAIKERAFRQVSDSLFLVRSVWLDPICMIVFHCLVFTFNIVGKIDLKLSFTMIWELNQSVTCLNQSVKPVVEMLDT